jgi:hypothetical protein
MLFQFVSIITLLENSFAMQYFTSPDSNNIMNCTEFRKQESTTFGTEGRRTIIYGISLLSFYGVSTKQKFRGVLQSSKRAEHHLFAGATKLQQQFDQRQKRCGQD